MKSQTPTRVLILAWVSILPAKSPAEMPPTAILPPEIWCIIYDWAIRSSIDIHEHCTSINFPEVILHLRSPSNHPSVSRAWLRELRLVCRASKAVLDSSPLLTIPMSEKAVYINPSSDVQLQFVLLLSDPLKSRRVILLDLPGSESSNSSAPILFDILCDNARSLPALRSLTMDFTRHNGREPVTPRFWGRLTEAFPDLECLVARGGSNTTEEGSIVTLKKLKVVDMDLLDADHQVRFPALRHSAFGSMNHSKAANFTGFQYLESLLLRNITDPEQFDWGFVPNLRLLGLPSGKVISLPPLPQRHPLNHLYVYVDTVPRTHNYGRRRRQEEWMWLKRTVERLPTISRITMAFGPTKSKTTDSIWGDFDDDEMHRLGFAAEYVFSGRTDAARHIIIERVDRVFPVVEATSGLLF